MYKSYTFFWRASLSGIVISASTHPTVNDLVLGNFLSLVFFGELELDMPVSEMFSREVLETFRVLLVVTVVDPELSDPMDSVFR